MRSRIRMLLWKRSESGLPRLYSRRRTSCLKKPFPTIFPHRGIKGLCKATEKRRKVIASKNSGFNRDYNLATQGIERADAEIEALRDTLLQLKDAEKKRKRDLMDIERKIEALRAQTAQRPPDGEPPELKAEMDQLGGQMRELQAEIMEDRAVHEGLVDQIDNNHREQRGIRNG